VDEEVLSEQFNETEKWLASLIEALKRQRSILEAQLKDLEKTRVNTGIGKLVLIVAKHNRARDWFNGTPVSRWSARFIFNRASSYLFI
jgi:hypothetical protein